MKSSEGLGSAVGQLNLLRESLATRRSVGSRTKSSSLAGGKECCGIPDRSAKDLRRSHQYDASAHLVQGPDRDYLFRRYVSDPSWCMADMDIYMDSVNSLKPLDRIATLYTPTACALTMIRARNVTSMSRSNDSSNSTQQRRHLTAPAAFDVAEQSAWVPCLTATVHTHTSDRQTTPRTVACSEFQSIIDRICIRGAYHRLTDLSRPNCLVSCLEPQVASKGNAKTLVNVVRLNFKKAIALSIAEYTSQMRPTRGKCPCLVASTGGGTVNSSMGRGARRESESPFNQGLKSTGQLQLAKMSRCRLRFTYAHLEERLSVVENLQVDLQTLWLGGANYFTTNKPGSPSSMSASKKLLKFLASSQSNLSSQRTTPHCDALLTDVGGLEFYKRLPMDLDTFCAYITSHSALVLDSLQDTWLTKASILLSEFETQFSEQNPGEKISRGSLREFEILPPRDLLLVPGHHEFCSGNVNGARETASVLMSRQLRVMCERSLHVFANFFKSFDLGTSSNEVSVIRLNLSLDTGLRFKPSPLLSSGTGDNVRLCPSLSELQNHADAAIECLVTSAGVLQLPRIGASLATCCVSLNDELVVRTRTAVQEVLAKKFLGPLQVVARFGKFSSLTNGTIDAEVRDAIIARAKTGVETIMSLDSLARLCSRLNELSEAARSVIADVVHISMFAVACGGCKCQLVQITDRLRCLVAESVCVDNRAHMTSICEEYSDVVERLRQERADKAHG